MAMETAIYFLLFSAVTECRNDSIQNQVRVSVEDCGPIGPNFWVSLCKWGCLSVNPIATVSAKL